MFDLLLLNLRGQGVSIGVGEWMTFLRGVQSGLVADLEGLYGFGRAVLCSTEADYDPFDLAFHATFEGVELPPKLSDALLEWVADALQGQGEKAAIDMDLDELRREFYERLKQQKERHDGGNHWVGTGGTSPFGSQGRADKGIRVGEGGSRSAVQVAEERNWRRYRTDSTLQTRDLQVALRALRSLGREGPEELDLDGTIRSTAHNAGDIDLVWQREKKNRVHLVLIMDTGGSMDPHTRLVTQLFTAAKAAKGFKSMSAYHFHNVPYGWLTPNTAGAERVRIVDLLREWTPAHRLVWVGDASMAPWELFSAGYSDWSRRGTGTSGFDWLKRIKDRCPASVWLNPDPKRYWEHPTVSAIGRVFPMFPLTVAGLNDAVKKLRVAR